MHWTWVKTLKYQLVNKSKKDITFGSNHPEEGTLEFDQLYLKSWSSAILKPVLEDLLLAEDQK